MKPLQAELNTRPKVMRAKHTSGIRFGALFGEVQLPIKLEQLGRNVRSFTINLLHENKLGLDPEYGQILPTCG